MSEALNIKVGGYADFKCDVEQSAEIIEITGKAPNRFITFKAPDDGFSGHYIGRADTHTEHESDCWQD
jgi:hypothetical protein